MASKIIKTCSICGNKHQAKGLCNRHYMRLLRHGDPEYSETIRGDGETVEERFWSRVDRSYGPQSCWIWQGKCSPYGVVNIDGKNQQAHRAAWFFTTGSFPKLDLLHSCDTPPCVNPAHLREGTNLENMKDKIARHRQARGEKISLAKLTWEKVKDIRENTDLPEKVFMAKYDLSRSAVSNIRRNISWKHVS